VRRPRRLLCSDRPHRPLAQYTSIRYSERISTAGITPSVGAVGSSYDCEDDGRSVGGLTLAYD